MTVPVLASIEFDEVARCLQAMGYEFQQREGSRVAFIIKNEELPLHKPHPQKELKKYVVRNLQKFITNTEDLL
ncbi:MAG: type II toxin-antitoxin system HicA family toxin [Candidatus Thioglobus sp.]|nr:type II toxin-antitoxin system HicA family toxin [Candidatus Thioglobus sp.]